MKLHREPLSRRIKAGEALRQEADPEFDPRQVLLAHREDIQSDFLALLGKLQSKGRFFPDAFSYLTAALLLDQITPGGLLSAEMKEEGLRVMNNHKPGNFRSAFAGELALGSWDSLSYGDWCQVFPEERTRVFLADWELEKVIQSLTTTSRKMLPVIRSAVLLAQVRPDKQAELKTLISLEDFGTTTWTQRDAAFSDKVELYRFLEKLSSIYLLYPDSRQRFVLRSDEKEQIIQFMSHAVTEVVGFEKGLHYATIVLADEGEIKPNGQIELRMKPRSVVQAQPLPVRPQA